MSKQPDFRWTPRLRKFAPPKPRSRQPISRIAVVLTVMIIGVAGLALYGYDHQRPTQTDTHVVHPRPDADGFSVPFGGGQLQLRFLNRAGSRYLSIEMAGSDGERQPPPRDAVFTLETVTEAGVRDVIAFSPEGYGFVSTRAVGHLSDRSSLIIDASGVRHVLALDNHPPITAEARETMQGAWEATTNKTEPTAHAAELRSTK